MFAQTQSQNPSQARGDKNSQQQAFQILFEKTENVPCHSNSSDDQISKLSNDSLNHKIKNLVGRERKITAQILKHIREVERRKLHLQMAYPSLFAYLTQEIGYSPACAMRRIDAARLSEVVPELIGHIQSGDFNISQASQANQAFREANKSSGSPVPIQKKKDILKKLINKNKQQTESILARELNIQPKTEDKQRTQADESIRVEMTFTRDEMALLKQAQARLSHKTGGGGLKETILELAKQVQNKPQNSVKLEARPGQRSLSLKERARNSTSAAEVKSVTPKLKREIISRDKHCLYVDPKTGRKCESTHFLEIDHIKPRYAGGSNSTENLRVLCDAHNRYRYEFERRKS